MTSLNFWMILDKSSLPLALSGINGIRLCSN
ncbi:unnamed protein product, partial [marine sediment metagenome]